MELTPSEPHAFLRRGARKWREGSGKKRCAADAGPHGERLRDDLLDFVEAAGGRLVLRDDGHGPGSENGAPLLDDGAGRDQIVGGDRTRRTAGNAGGLAHIGNNFVERVSLSARNAADAVNGRK